MLRCGENAPRVGERPIHCHKRIAVHGSQGHVQWTMWSWEALCDGALESGDHDYWEEDILGQAAMAEAMFDWLEDDAQEHPLNLRLALQDFGVILGVYQRALRRQPVSLPPLPDPDLIARLRTALDSGGST